MWLDLSYLVTLITQLTQSCCAGKNVVKFDKRCSKGKDEKMRKGGLVF